MAIELVIPSFGESISDVILGDWLKSPGERVAQDDPVVVLETDKVTAELPAPASGVIREIFKKAGDTAEVGEVIGTMEAVEAEALGTETPAAPTPVAEAEKAPATAPAGAESRVMPAARHALAEHGLAASEVAPTGPGGRLLKEDVLRHSAAPVTPGLESVTFGEPQIASERQEDVVPMTPLRKRIAERLVESQQTAALLTTFNEIDMSAVIALRKQYKESYQAKHGVKLGFMSFFVKAAIEGLKELPALNAQIQGESIVYHNYYDVGVAIGGGRGLVVPILRNAERLGFADIEKQIGDFAERAQNGKLGLDELQGGTFTISNGGVYGSLLSTPIVNPPQSGILGLHTIQERPVAVNGEVVIRPMMYVALTYDHRIIDGREGVRFLLRVKECIENPSRILLEV